MRAPGLLLLLSAVQLSAPAQALVKPPRWRAASLDAAPRRVPPERCALRLRGGAATSPVPALALDRWFNRYFAGLVTVCTATRLAARAPAAEPSGVRKESKAWNLQWRFLSVFWVLKLADWLHGPYFYEVYASKVIGGKAMGQDMIGKLFLCGFGASMVFGTVAGTLVDTMGRKKGCLAFAALYIMSALSTRSNALSILVLGRILGGTATSLLFSAPEAWLVSEHSRHGLPGEDLGATFGWAYFGDGIAAILAGKLAGAVAGRAGGGGSVLSGPTAPFELSVGFLALGAALIVTFFGENYGGSSSSAEEQEAKRDAGLPAPGKGVAASLQEAVGIIASDKRILLTGLVQALFEGAMYIFVLQWPPAMSAMAGDGSVPFGAVFACLMTACMIGSSIFGLMLKHHVPVELGMAGMLGVASSAMVASATAASRGEAVGRRRGLHALTLSCLAFEMAVGFYFPSIGTLRSKYVPDAHKGSILNVFRIPLNLIVISTFLSINRLGVSGALALAAAILGVACAAQMALVLLPAADSAPTAAPAPVSAPALTGAGAGPPQEHAA